MLKSGISFQKMRREKLYNNCMIEFVVICSNSCSYNPPPKLEDSWSSNMSSCKKFLKGSSIKSGIFLYFLIKKVFHKTEAILVSCEDFLVSFNSCK